MRRALPALLILAACVGPAPRQAFVAATPAVAAADSCDDPHPKNRDGSLRHDWMRGGDNVYRCWYCNIVKR